jgi:hypothetical protein
LSNLLSISINFLPLDIICFSLTLWLGAYLLKRNLPNIRVGLTGLSLILYACSEGWFILSTTTSPLDAPLMWIGRWLLCCVLFVQGIIVAAQDATDQGEALLPDLSRSFDYALLTALVFGGQMALVMLTGTGVTFLSLLLLLSTLTTAIIIQVFSRTFVTLLDTIAFATFPQLKQARAELHTAIDVLPRLQQELDLDELDELEFTRLTRRALSHLGDLPQLASNPLTHLLLVKARLQARSIKNDDVLESAAELKMVLTESICRLKPRDKGEFGSSDEWRYYNALHFPYVIGLKPYSRRTQHEQSDPITREALNWFLTQVPERTLHNWQNTAAKLVAQDLRSQTSTISSQKQLSNIKTGSVWQ